MDTEHVPANETQNTTAAHLEQARQRARGLFGSEVAHDRPYEIVHAATAGRDSVVVVLMLWGVLLGIGAVEHAFAALLAAAIAAAVHTGISNALAVYAQLRYWEGELRREREEIRTQPEHEREELRMLYQAKGFSGELLEAIVDTISNDEERLLKVMLEEELGIFFEQRNHPLVTGLFTAVASLAGGVLIALAAASGHATTAIVTTAIVLAVLCLVRHGIAVLAGVESFARWSILAGTIWGLAYLLGRLFVA